MHSQAKKITIQALLPLLLLLWGGSLWANISQQSDSRRSIFIAAEKALEQGDQAAYGELKRQLGDYPLTPYLEFQELTGSISRQKSADIERFLSQHSNTPLAARLKRIWLRELAKRKQWWTYLVFYRPTSDITLRCHQATALLETGKKQLAFSQAPEIWLSGRSRPDACDPLFKAWKAAGGLTSDLVWGRIALAMQRNNRQLTRYLKKQLPTAQQAAVDTWLTVHHSPGQLAATLKKRPLPPNANEMLLQGLKQLARKELETALDLWESSQLQQTLSLEEQNQAQRGLAMEARRQDHAIAMTLLDSYPPTPDDHRFHEARIRHALEHNHWQLAMKWIQALPTELAVTERWRYWQGRILQQTGDTEAGGKILNRLASERSYHGFLAADHLDLEYAIGHTPLQMEQERLQQIAALPGIVRAGELMALERMIDARREWHWVTRSMERDQLQAAAKLAQSWGWHDRAIFTLARTGYWEDLDLRFPLEHKDQIARNAARQQIDDAWVFAVVRQESAFSTDARSSAGAMGLMQLMPRTAKSVARKLKNGPFRKQQLFTPKINIRFGTAYLRQVLDQLGEHQVLATAAYNAGPHRVKSWLPESETDAALWIETIPFKETRTYVQRVLAYAVIYEKRLGKKPSRLIDRMPPVIPENPAASAPTVAASGDSAAL